MDGVWKGMGSQTEPLSRGGGVGQRTRELIYAGKLNIPAV